MVEYIRVWYIIAQGKKNEHTNQIGLYVHLKYLFE